MLAIARGLMGRPKCLLLDEPTLGLAPLIVDEIGDTITKLARSGLAILLAEQNAAMALAVAHRAYVLTSGRIAAEGIARRRCAAPPFSSSSISVQRPPQSEGDAWSAAARPWSMSCGCPWMAIRRALSCQSAIWHAARTVACDVLVVGGGTGGVAAALAAARRGRRVHLTEETDWIGGQLTAQGVSALDEHEHIEAFGGTASYYRLRNACATITGPLAGDAGKRRRLQSGKLLGDAPCVRAEGRRDRHDGAAATAYRCGAPDPASAHQARCRARWKTIASSR